MNWTQFKALLGRRVSGSSLAAFRIGFGLVAMGETYSLLHERQSVRWLDMFNDQHTWRIPFPGLEWLEPLSPTGMEFVAWTLGVAGAFLAVGFLYRLAAFAVFASWTYVVLLDAAQYNNHYYLTSVLAAFFIFTPGARCYSIDGWWKRRRMDAAQRATSGEIPFWVLFLFRGQWLVVYFFAGLTKIHVDWLLGAEPVTTMLRAVFFGHKVEWLVGEETAAAFEAMACSAPVAYTFAWTAMLYDLTVGFLFLIRRTRLLALGLTAMFHGLNHFIFLDDIGWFPLMGMFGTGVFFDPDWPARVWKWLRAPRIAAPDWGWFLAGIIAVPGIGALLGWSFAPSSEGEERWNAERFSVWRVVPMALVVWFAVQIAMPLRHFTIAGDVNWTSEGDRWAWRMKATTKQAARVAIRLDDASRIGAGGEGGAPFEWDDWTGDRTVYHPVDGRDVDLADLPEIVAVYQPGWGERLLYNCASRQAAASRSRDAVAERVEAIWKDREGEAPRIQESVDLDVALRTIVRQQINDTAFVESVQAARGLLERLRTEELSGTERRSLARELQSRIFRICRSPGVGGVIRPELSRAGLFAVEGRVERPGTFWPIESRSLMTIGPSNQIAIDRDALLGDGDTHLDVYLDLETVTGLQWVGLPLAIPCADAAGQYYVHWNRRRDLRIFRMRRTETRAYFMYQYVQWIAERWESRYGARPEIRVWAEVAVNQHPPQLLIDPSVDLAAAPMKWYGHNSWILLRSESRSAEDSPMWE